MTEQEEGKAKRLRRAFIPMAHTIYTYVLGQFEHLESFKDFTISAIENEKTAIQDRFARHTDGMSEDETERYMDFVADEYFIVEDLFSKFSLNSFAIILYSYIESGLNSLCDVLYSDQRRKCEKIGGNPIQIRYTHMKGKGIDRAKIYLQKVFNVDLHTGEQPWQEIKALQSIRNVIVHDEGWADEDIIKNPRIKDCMEKGEIDIERRRDGSLGKIIIKPEYLDRILDQTQKFFRNIEWRD